MKYLDLTGLGEVWANIKSYISSKIPTKTSQLQNDSNYATTSQLPSKTSQLINDSDFTTNAKLTSKANDSDVVHKTGSETIAGSKTFSSNIVGNLTGNADTATKATQASYSNQLQAFTGDDFTGGNHFVKAIRSTSGWSTRLWMCYYGGAKTSNEISVAYADSAGNADTATKATQDAAGNIITTTYAKNADVVFKTSTDYTFRNYGLNSLNIDEKTNENYVVGISGDGYGTRPVSGWTNIINFCTYHFITQLCIPIHPNKDADCMYIRTRWANDTTWGEWRKSANDNSVVHKSGYETISGIKNFNDVVLGEQSGVIRIGNNGEGALFCNLYYDGGIYNNLQLFYPKTTNEYNLGTPTHKWKTLNGINPGALSLPDHSSYLDITGNLPASVSDNAWIPRCQITPDRDGILILSFNDCAAVVVWSNSNLPSYGDRGTSICTEKRVMAFLLKGVTYNVFTNNYSQVALARLFYCQGNV